MLKRQNLNLVKGDKGVNLTNARARVGRCYSRVIGSVWGVVTLDKNRFLEVEPTQTPTNRKNGPLTRFIDMSREGTGW